MIFRKTDKLVVKNEGFFRTKSLITTHWFLFIPYFRSKIIIDFS